MPFRLRLRIAAFLDSWQTYGMGDVFDVPGGTKHAFRNVSGEIASTLIVTTMALARFLAGAGLCF